MRNFIIGLIANLFVLSAAQAQVVSRNVTLEGHFNSVRLGCGEPTSNFVAFQEYAFYEMPAASHRICQGKPLNTSPITFNTVCTVETLDDGQTFFRHNFKAEAVATCVSKQ